MSIACQKSEIISLIEGQVKKERCYFSLKGKLFRETSAHSPRFVAL